MRKNRTTVACHQCGTLMSAAPWQLATGRGKFCSSDCYHASVRARDRHFVERFWSNVDKSGECWIWTGMVNDFGYGIFSMRHRQYRTHRMSYEMAYGPIPDGMMVLHRCDVPACLRPGHLFLGLHADNTADMVAKRRQAFGRRHGMAILTVDDVREIRSLYALGGMTQRALGSAYNVDEETIGNVIRRENWQHVE